jgi:hypothetical protein
MNTLRNYRPAMLAVLLGASTAAAASAEADDMLAPGRYEVDTRTEYVDVPIPETTITTQNCLTAEDLEAGAGNILAGLPANQNCQIGEFVMAEGALDMTMSCAADDGDMDMVTSGTYTSNGYEMTSNVTVTVGDKSIVMQSTVQGTRVGDC